MDTGIYMARFMFIFVPLLFIIGLYCVIITRNLIRVLIGLELMTKAVTLLIVYAGYVTGRKALAQELAITLIIVEVVVIAVAAGIVINIFKHNNSLNTKKIRTLKG